MLDTSICISPSISHDGGSICSIIVSNIQWTLSVSSSKCIFAIPFLADAYITGKSSCSSFASNSINSSNTWSTTFNGFAPGLSILFITTIGFKFNAKDFLNYFNQWNEKEIDKEIAQKLEYTLDMNNLKTLIKLNIITLNSIIELTYKLKLYKLYNTPRNLNKFF